MFIKKYILLLTCFIFGMFQSLNAQAYPADENPWIFGFGVNVIYDSGEELRGILDVRKNYNYDIPLRFSLEKRMALHYGIEVSANFNRLLKGKYINKIQLGEDIDFFAIDGMFKYYLTDLFLNTHRSIFEGYIATGASANYYDGDGGLSFNGALGLNLFITERFRLTGQVVAKFAKNKDELRSNFLQFNLGFIIRFKNMHFR